MNKIRENLWIGDIQDAREGDTSQFDRVITICQDDISDNIGCEYNHFPLSDGPAPRDAYNPGKFDFNLFRDAVNTIIESVKNGENVFVHCHAGRSRSVMATVCSISVLDGLDYQDAYWEVSESRGHVNPSPEIVEFAERYLGVNYDK